MADLFQLHVPHTQSKGVYMYNVLLFSGSQFIKFWPVPAPFNILYTDLLITYALQVKKT